MTKREYVNKIKEYVSMLNGTEFTDNGIPYHNHPLIKRIAANARNAYLTTSGRLSPDACRYHSDEFPIIGLNINETDEFGRVLYASLIVEVNGVGRCEIPFIDMN